MTKRPPEQLSSNRLQGQLRSLQAQVAEPSAVSRKQLLEALGALQESLQELDVAEAELAPGMSGSELAAQLEADRPGIRVLYISGYPEDAIARHGVLHAGRSFLQKPFPPGVLLQTVRQILDQGDRWPVETSS